MFVMTWALELRDPRGSSSRADYAATAGMRPPAEAQKILHWLFLGEAIFAVAFAWIYYQGKEDKPG